MERQIVIRDSWGRTMAHCTGPAPDGRCPRVEIGETVPCAGCTIAPDGAAPAVRYTVGADEVSCPVIIGMALAGTPDTARVG